MKRIYEIAEVRLTDAGLSSHRTVDAKARITDAAVLVTRLNAQSQGTSFRYIYRSVRVD